MSSTFTTREVALIIWTLVFFGWVTARRDARKSLGGVLSAALQWKILVPFLLVVAYIALVVLVLHTLGVWTPDLLKDTILWFVFSGVAVAFSGMSLNSDGIHWRRVISGQLKAIVLLEYVVNTYMFALWIELLLVPTLVIVSALDVVVKMDDKHRTMAKLIGALQALFGFTILAFALRQAVSTRDTFSTMETLRAIARAPLLSALLLPVAYLFAIVSVYEQLFIRLAIGPTKDASVVRYAKRKLPLYLGLRPAIVRAFTRQGGARGYSAAGRTRHVVTYRLTPQIPRLAPAPRSCYPPASRCKPRRVRLDICLQSVWQETRWLGERY